MRCRSIELELPLFHELHGRCTGDGLGHGSDPHDRVERHRRVDTERSLTVRACIHQSRAPGRHRHHTGHFAGCHRIGEQCVDLGVEGGHGGDYALKSGPRCCTPSPERTRG